MNTKICTGMFVMIVLVLLVAPAAAQDSYPALQTPTATAVGYPVPVTTPTPTPTPRPIDGTPTSLGMGGMKAVDSNQRVGLGVVLLGAVLSLCAVFFYYGWFRLISLKCKRWYYVAGAKLRMGRWLVASQVTEILPTRCIRCSGWRLRLEPLTLKGVRAVLRGGAHGAVCPLTRQSGGWKHRSCCALAADSTPDSMPTFYCSTARGTRGSSLSDLIKRRVYTSRNVLAQQSLEKML